MSSAATGNQWFLNGDPIVGATGQYLEISGEGTYHVQVTSPEGCTSPMSDPFLYVGVEEKIGAENVTVFPNPTTGIVYIRISGRQTSVFDTEIFNTLGKSVFSSKNQAAIDLSGLAGGIYYLCLRTDRSEYVTKKLILIK